MSGISLEKAENINLTKEAEGVNLFEIGLSWDPATDGKKYDLDASAFLLGANGKLKQDLDFVFYNNLTDPAGAVKHSGDNRDGEAEGFDEVITVDVSKIPVDVQKVVVVVSIHTAKEPTLNFGQVKKSKITICNGTTHEEIAFADLNEDYSGKSAISFGELYRNGADWKFKSDPVAVIGGLQTFVDQYGG